MAYSKLFRKRFESVCLAELDPQGTISHWHSERENAGYPAYNISFVTLLKNVQRKLTKLVREHDALILDVPGESVGRFATRLAVSLSDVALIPMGFRDILLIFLFWSWFLRSEFSIQKEFYFFNKRIRP